MPRSSLTARPIAGRDAVLRNATPFGSGTNFRVPTRRACDRARASDCRWCTSSRGYAGPRVTARLNRPIAATTRVHQEACAALRPHRSAEPLQMTASPWNVLGAIRAVRGVGAWHRNIVAMRECVVVRSSHPLAPPGQRSASRLKRRSRKARRTTSWADSKKRSKSIRTRTPSLRPRCCSIWASATNSSRIQRANPFSKAIFAMSSGRQIGGSRRT